MPDPAIQKRCAELAPVFQAGADGKEIEWFSTMEQQWYPARRQLLGETKYRVKPEPSLRAFTHRELAGQIGAKIRSKLNTGVCEVIWGITGDERIILRDSHYELVGLAYLSEFWEFTDGSPCGVLIP